MIKSPQHDARRGSARPFGATVRPEGVNFAVFSRNARRMWLALFDGDPRTPVSEHEMKPETHRTGDVWSVFIGGLEPGAKYMFRAEGPSKPEAGHRFDAERFLLDPCARVITGSVDDGSALCVVADPEHDWQEDRSPRHGMADLVVYETHVKSFTAHPSSGVEHPGTYLGFIEKIPHLVDLGVNAVELLPVHHCGERTITVRSHPETGEHLTNLWGYQPIGYYAPDGFYATDDGEGAQLVEFRALVRALHHAGIEVIIDVVFNHTAEYGKEGPTLCFRGLDNTVYYHLDDAGGYRDFTGCGNAVNCNHPVVRDFILDCLRYWVLEMHVDGFRFDLASILNRDREGHLHGNAPLVDHIAEDPVLRDVKLIAEPWDIAGGYQLGGFGGPAWGEWNARYRDDVRRFWRGDAGSKGDFARRITGSPDIYQSGGRTPLHSVNFITAHDGFTLRDLVSYNKKHNEANGEGNRDGLDENYSWNCGAEGPTDDPIVTAMRDRMERSLTATLLLSLGVPMLHGGDECGRTQLGNNNAYCQDNELSWHDWTLAETNASLLRFTREMIAFRRENPVFRQATFFTGRAVKKGGEADLLWFDPAGNTQGWDAGNHTLACRIDGSVNGGVTLYMVFNPSAQAVEFTLPKGSWKLRINTAKLPPNDICAKDKAPDVSEKMLVGQKALCVFTAEGQ
jgi:isoamylase